jgi:hypothetical protein
MTKRYECNQRNDEPDRVWAWLGELTFSAGIVFFFSSTSFEF